VNSFLLLLTYEVGHIILFTRYTLTSAHISIIPEFIDKIETADLHNDFHITKDEIVNLKTGSKIIFRGIKTSSGTQTANLKSLQGVTTWILDEAEELTDENTFDKINLSIRQKGKQNRVILILNPTTKEHWIYKRFFESEGVKEGFNGIKDDVTYIHTTYEDNIDNLDQSFINEILKLKINNPQKYNHQILGGWLNRAEGVIFSNWRIDNFNEVNGSIFGQDFGFSIDPTTLVQVSIDKANKRIYAKEHLYKAGLNTTEIYQYNLRFCGNNNLIIADSAEPRLISELKNRGLNIKGVEKPKIVDLISYDLFEQSLNHNNQFLIYLTSLFGEDITHKVNQRFFIGTSKHWQGACVFWQIDSENNIHTGKIMLFNPTTGKRVKTPYNHILKFY
jgi:phage terminase large subunit